MKYFGFKGYYVILLEFEEEQGDIKIPWCELSNRHAMYGQRKYYTNIYRDIKK